MSERDTLIETLDLHRGFLLHTADGLSEADARRRSTVSELTIAALLKHVADTEAQWIDFADRGAEAFAPMAGAADQGEAQVDAADQGEAPGDGADPRFALGDGDTLDSLRNRMATVAARTTEFLRAADLDAEHPLPEAPWFEPGRSWSVRRVAVHLIAEISQHAGHADIIREAIDGQKTMG